MRITPRLSRLVVLFALLWAVPGVPAQASPDAAFAPVRAVVQVKGVAGTPLLGDVWDWDSIGH